MGEIRHAASRTGAKTPTVHTVDTVDIVSSLGFTAQPRAVLGRPRSDVARQSILDAARDLIVRFGFEDLHLEHVAAKAGVGKATIYRRWSSKEALALDLLLELATPHLVVVDTGDTREELVAVVHNTVRALAETPFGMVLKALMSQIAINPALGDSFRRTIVTARQLEIEAVLQRGIARRDLRPDVDVAISTELLVAPVYFRLVLGGNLDRRFAEDVADAVLAGLRNPRRRARRSARQAE